MIYTSSPVRSVTNVIKRQQFRADRVHIFIFKRRCGTHICLFVLYCLFLQPSKGDSSHTFQNINMIEDVKLLYCLFQWKSSYSDSILASQSSNITMCTLFKAAQPNHIVSTIHQMMLVVSKITHSLTYSYSPPREF